MPVLIALAFRETKLFWGVVLFTILVALGLSIRFLLERLRLLLVPRLSAVLIVVVILMLLISLMSHRLGMETGLSVALFPMVIIAMTIERMSVVWEERGAPDAMRAGFGSLIVAVIAYAAMGWAWLEHLIFTFPELLLVVLALVLLAGRYTGYRLLELSRFKKPNSCGRRACSASMSAIPITLCDSTRAGFIRVWTTRPSPRISRSGPAWLCRNCTA
jgi:hypothetical protein